MSTYPNILLLSLLRAGPGLLDDARDGEQDALRLTASCVSIIVTTNVTVLLTADRNCLKQFNPMIVFVFEIPVGGLTALKAYNITGGEV
jgi:hypothetical protein